MLNAIHRKARDVCSLTNASMHTYTQMIKYGLSVGNSFSVQPCLDDNLFRFYISQRFKLYLALISALCVIKCVICG